MKTITLVGAGGKMGCRLTDNFLNTRYQVHYLEVFGITVKFVVIVLSQPAAFVILVM